MDQQHAVGEGDAVHGCRARRPRPRLPRSRPSRLDTHLDTAFEHLKRNTAPLITLVECGAGAERDEDQPEGSDFGQRPGISVASANSCSARSRADSSTRSKRTSGTLRKRASRSSLPPVVRSPVVAGSCSISSTLVPRAPTGSRTSRRAQRFHGGPGEAVAAETGGGHRAADREGDGPRHRWCQSVGDQPTVTAPPKRLGAHDRQDLAGLARACEGRQSGPGMRP